MTLALPAFWLYSCLTQSTGSASVTVMRSAPPVQGAFVQVWKALMRVCSIWVNVTCVEASFCSDQPTQGLAQKSGLPQSPGSDGVHTCDVPTLGQLEVR